MKIGKIEITASRFPWQNISIPGNPRGKYGWRPDKAYMCRFGGGWRYCLGINVGRTAMVINLLFGIIRISWSGK